MARATSADTRSDTIDLPEAWRLYRGMVRIRQIEQAIARLFAEGRLPGFVHLAVGEEAIAVGAIDALQPHDMVFSTHRPHAHALQRGVTDEELLAEVFGFRNGASRGRGGSMHVFKPHAGFLGANGIVGGGAPIATGAALGAQLAENSAVALVFLGDGAMMQGGVHEALNLASIWRLPVIYVCENNGTAQATPKAYFTRIEAFSEYAQLLGIRAVRVDGNDVYAVRKAVQQGVGQARRGDGPVYIEAMTWRWHGHFEGDPLDPFVLLGEDRSRRQQEDDPIKRLEDRMLAASVDRDEFEKVWDEISNAVASAIAAVEASGEMPEEQECYQDVYGDYPSEQLLGVI